MSEPPAKRHRGKEHEDEDQDDDGDGEDESESEDDEEDVRSEILRYWASGGFTRGSLVGDGFEPEMREGLDVDGEVFPESSEFDPWRDNMPDVLRCVKRCRDKSVRETFPTLTDLTWRMFLADGGMDAPAFVLHASRLGENCPPTALGHMWDVEDDALLDLFLDPETGTLLAAPDGTLENPWWRKAECGGNGGWGETVVFTEDGMTYFMTVCRGYWFRVAHEEWMACFAGFFGSAGPVNDAVLAEGWTVRNCRWFSPGLRRLAALLLLVQKRGVIPELPLVVLELILTFCVKTGAPPKANEEADCGPLTTEDSVRKALGDCCLLINETPPSNPTSPENDA